MELSKVQFEGEILIAQECHNPSLGHIYTGQSCKIYCAMLGNETFCPSELPSTVFAIYLPLACLKNFRAALPRFVIIAHAIQIC